MLEGGRVARACWPAAIGARSVSLIVSTLIVWCVLVGPPFFSWPSGATLLS
jgi:hypothetical protein